jgi:hypothetical protein
MVQLKKFLLFVWRSSVQRSFVWEHSALVVRSCCCSSCGWHTGIGVEQFEKQ